MAAFAERDSNAGFPCVTLSFELRTFCPKFKGHLLPLTCEYVVGNAILGSVLPPGVTACFKELGAN
jgi:hypothetical protein